MLKRSIVESIKENPEFREELEKSKENFTDSLPIPLDDPEPQVLIPYSREYPYHCQIHRDSFSYGGIGPRADPRVVVDLRYFGKHDVKRENRVFFAESKNPRAGWEPGITDIHGMPQPTVSYISAGPESVADNTPSLKLPCLAMTKFETKSMQFVFPYPRISRIATG